MATHPPDPKIALFGDLLKDAFAGHQLYDMPIGDRSSHLFRIDHGGTIAHRIYVSREFFGDHRDEEIGALFREWRVADRIREAGPRAVTVTNNGVTVGGMGGGSTMARQRDEGRSPA